MSPTQGFIVVGDAADDQFGTSVSVAGDVNGDGVIDFIVGAPYGDDAGSDGGEAYIVFGKSAGIGTANSTGRLILDVTSLGASDGFIIRSNGAGDSLGYSVSSAGDINGDGLDDLLVGANNGGDGGVSAGEAYVVFGSTAGFGTNVSGRQVIDLSTLSAAQGFVIQGDTAGDQLGISVSSLGDINNDGYDDIIVGAYQGGDGGAGAGEAYVIFGTSAGFGTTVSGRKVIDTTSLTASQGFIIQGDLAGDQLGLRVSSAGDLNNDGYDDIAVGATGGDDGGSSAGEVYIVFGSSVGFGSNVGGRQVIDTTSLSAAQGFIVQGDVANDNLYRSFTVGDLNHDGIDDLAIGATSGNAAGTDFGEVYVIFGATLGFGASVSGRQVIDLTALVPSQGFIVTGDQAYGSFGASISSAGDFNGDGIDDMVIGQSDSNAGGASSGMAYVIYGTTTGFGTVVGGRQVLSIASIDPSIGFAIQGDKAQDNLGTSVSSVGDMNGDGFDDIILSAPRFDESGSDSAGGAFVIYGTSALTGSMKIGTASADHLTGTSGADNLVGGGGGDVLLGYGGDDILTVASTSFTRIDGGAGTDTLILSGTGLHLNLTTRANDVVTDIEIIDITGTGANTLTVSAQDVLDLSSTTNTLIVNGNNGDTVNASGFADSGANQTIGSITYDVYTNGSATIWIDQEINNVVLT